MQIFQQNRPNDPSVTYLSAKLYYAQEQYDLAETQAKMCLASAAEDGHKKDCILLLLDIYCLNPQPDYDSLLDFLDDASANLSQGPYIELIEREGELYFERAAQSKDDNDYLQAAACFDQLLQLGYRRAHIYRNAGIALQYAKSFDKAQEVLLEMSSEFPENYLSYYQLAFLYIEMEGLKPVEERDYSRVIEMYEKVIELTNGTPNQTSILPLTDRIAELAEKGWN